MLSSLYFLGVYDMYKILLADKRNVRSIRIGSWSDAMLYKALGFVVLSMEKTNV